ncbi:MAG: hypothetical protein IPQ09_17440 [Myxococcales bacterium]|nr:hypothetical protein [Myxococcales bacterium]
MPRPRRFRPLALAAGVAASLLGGASLSAAAPPPPTGPHPRILLNKATLDALKARAAVSGSATAKMIARCDAVVANPSRYSEGVYTGYGWAFNGSACALAFQLTQKTTYRTEAVKYLNALLDDRDQMGDGRGGDLVTNFDTGYPIRHHGTFAALLYDWLPGAPGVDAARTRARIKVWVDRYTREGYLRDVPGGNYHAGYVSAKTFAAIALAGEDAAATAYYNDVVDNLFTKQIGGVGLGPKGTMLDGDWPEGWEYAPFSMMGYGLAWRALRDQGISLPQVDQFFDDAIPLYRHTFTPNKKFGWAGGDWGTNDLYATLSRRGVVASMLAGKNPTNASWGAALLADTALGEIDECLACEALAETRGAAPVDYVSTKPPTFYLARGTRNLYSRSSWAADAFWSVFTSAPRLGPDHQHIDASNFAFARGADHLIVDPSPYGSLSTLTGNAITVDSKTVGADYQPGQSARSQADLPWARGFESGVVTARAELSKAFADSEGKTDVPFARRDYAFLPDGEVITIDRARTDDPARGMALRFRSMASLTLDAGGAGGAKGNAGSSQLVLHAVVRSGGTPEVRKIPRRECSGSRYGLCDGARYPVDEYRVKVPGPTALAVHVFDATATGEAGATTTDITKVDAKNTGVVGVEVVRSGRTLMVASSAKDGAAGAELAYLATGDAEARHIVFDGPETDGKSNVTATPEGGKCAVKVTPGAALQGRPLVFRVAASSAGCTVTEDKGVALAKPPGPGEPGGPPGPGEVGADGGPGAGGPGAGGEGDSSGCSCDAAGRPSAWASGIGALVALGALAMGRRRRRAT